VHKSEKILKEGGLWTAYSRDQSAGARWQHTQGALAEQSEAGSLVLSCLIRATGWANAPRWGGRLRCWLATPLPLPQQWTCSAVQIVTRVPLSLYLGPRLVNVVSVAYKTLTANHVCVGSGWGRRYGPIWRSRANDRVVGWGRRYGRSGMPDVHWGA
jgi:hypothetical protein